jgi:hypothetical protein
MTMLMTSRAAGFKEDEVVSLNLNICFAESVDSSHVISRSTKHPLPCSLLSARCSLLSLSKRSGLNLINRSKSRNHLDKINKQAGSAQNGSDDPRGARILETRLTGWHSSSLGPLEVQGHN